MKQVFLFLLGALFLTSARAQQINDPNAQVREAKNYHGIELSNAFDVYLTQGNEETVAVSAANVKDRDQIIVEVKNGILYIGLEHRGFRISTGNKKYKAYISFKMIDKLNISGACDVYVSGAITADNLKIDLSGASNLKGKFDIKTMDIDLSGASDMTATGTATQLSVEASGASEFKGYGFATDICNAKATGASDIRITVNKELSAHASGASDVKYKGDGVVKDMHSSGASSISKG